MKRFCLLFTFVLLTLQSIWAQGGLFNPLPGCRVVDTRWATGSLGGPYLHGGVARSFPIISSSCIPTLYSIPVAYAFNVTVVPRGPFGYVRLWPTGQTMPVVSTLNWQSGQVVANSAIVTFGWPQGDVSVYSTTNTDVIIDIVGYYLPLH